jgi:Leucine-rich repeat (LRR) protein
MSIQPTQVKFRKLENVATPTDQPSFQPLSLQELAVSIIIKSYFKDMSSLGKVDRSEVDCEIDRAWRRLRTSCEGCGLGLIMLRVENSLVKDKVAHFALPREERDNTLIGHASKRFKKLGKIFNTKNAIPVDLASYRRAQHLVEDRALQMIWNEGLKYALGMRATKFNIKEIKAYFSNPDNAPPLGNITNLTPLRRSVRAIPPEIGALTGLKSFKCTASHVRSIPDSFANLINLKKLILNNNKICGIPESLSQLAELETLDLSDNCIYEIPDSLAKLTHLRKLDLGYNFIEKIPNSLAKLTELKILNLHKNPGCGRPILEIPDSLGSCTSLQELFLGFNEISKLPDSLANLTNLKKFILNNNKICDIPKSLAKLTQLKNLNLHHNTISNIPDWFAAFINLRELKLGHNLIEKIPDSLFKLTKLKNLDLEKNRISEISHSFNNLINLTNLQLNNNQISVIPDGFSKLVNLDVLGILTNPLSSTPDFATSHPSMSQLY